MLHICDISPFSRAALREPSTNFDECVIIPFVTMRTPIRSDISLPLSSDLIVQPFQLPFVESTIVLSNDITNAFSAHRMTCTPPIRL